jgi:methyl-accepting chemotaxis protein
MTRTFDLIIRPAVRLAGRLSLAWKIALVCAVLLVPTLLLGNGYRSGMGAQTSFAATERSGVDYARPLMGLLASTVRLRSADVAAALGEKGAGTSAGAARSEIAADTRTLDALVAKHAGGLDVATQWQQAKSAVSDFASRQAGSRPAAEIAAADGALAAINAALAQTLNDSNLILDPDLDSYSAMDAWLLRMPVVLDLATRSSAQISVALESGPTADRALAVQLAADKARLDDALAAVGADVAAARTSTRDTTAAAEMTAPVAPLRAALSRLDAALTAGMRGTGLPRTTAASGAAVAASAVALGKTYPVTLDRLLRERSSRLDGTLYRDLLIAAIFLVLAAYMVVAIVVQIRRAIAPVLDCTRSLMEHCATELRIGLERISKGDLTFAVTPVTPPIEHVGRDEIGEVSAALNGIRERTLASVDAYNETRAALGELVGSLQTASGTVSSASEQVAVTSAEAGRAVGEIATAVGDIAQGAERQVRMVEETRRSAEETASRATAARDVALEGVNAAQQASQAIQTVQESTERVTEAIRGLEAKSEQIGGIVETITGLAGQTNLLALNAAIEAARAGEQGRGFAVVAEEVRKLAEESQRAAGEIAELIAEIQTETQVTVAAVAEGAERTRDGVAVVEQAREAFEQIGVQVDEVTSRIAEIVNATAEVATVAEQSSASTEEVSASTQQTSASTQEIASSAQHLAATAQQLQDLIATFTVAA